MTNEELAYIAGIIDGEGCISYEIHIQDSINKNSINPRVQFVNTDKRMIDFVSSRFKFGHVYVKTPSAEGNKIRYEYRVSKLSDVLKFLTEIEPYLVCKRLGSRYRWVKTQYLKKRKNWLKNSQ